MLLVNTSKKKRFIWEEIIIGKYLYIMAKVVKLKQKDIENIVHNIIINENFGGARSRRHYYDESYDDFDTQIQPEELHGDEPEDFKDDEPYMGRVERDPRTGRIINPDDAEEENMGIEDDDKMYNYDMEDVSDGLGGSDDLDEETNGEHNRSVYLARNKEDGKVYVLDAQTNEVIGKQP